MIASIGTCEGVAATIGATFVRSSSWEIPALARSWIRLAVPGTVLNPCATDGANSARPEPPVADDPRVTVPTRRKVPTFEGVRMVMVSPILVWAISAVFASSTT